MKDRSFYFIAFSSFFIRRLCASFPFSALSGS